METIMSKEVNFLIYCIEKYKLVKNITGRQAIELFEKFDITKKNTSDNLYS